MTQTSSGGSWHCLSGPTAGPRVRASVPLALCPLRAVRPRGEWARRHVGPSVAWARRGRPRAFLAREENAAGALREQLAARWPARSAESWGRSLARPPPLSPLLGLLCRHFARALQGAAPPRAVAPGKFASPGRARRWRLRAQRRRRPRKPQPLQGGVGGGSRALASPRRKRLPRAICNRPQLVSAPRPRAGGRASAWGRGGDPRLRTLAARQRRARSNQSSCHLSPPGTG